MNANLKKHDAVWEPELRELCGELDAIQRAKTAEKFMRWADQLTESAIRMEPGIVPLIPPPKVPRGFFLVNMGRWQEDVLRALAHECGVELRSVLRWAITTTHMKLEEHHRVAKLAGIPKRECWRYIAGNKSN